MLQVDGTIVGWIAKKIQKGANTVNVPNAPHKKLNPYVTGREPVRLTFEVSTDALDVSVAYLSALWETNTTITCVETEGYPIYNNSVTVSGVIASPITPVEDVNRVGTFTIELVVTA